MHCAAGAVQVSLRTTLRKVRRTCSYGVSTLGCGSFLLSTDSDSIPDTGPVAAGARYTVYVKATLPTNISTTAPFTVTKTAVSNLGGTPDTVTDRLGFLAAATVDITNNAAVGGGLPNGDGPGTAAVITANTVNPGASHSYRQQQRCC